MPVNGYNAFIRGQEIEIIFVVFVVEEDGPMKLQTFIGQFEEHYMLCEDD